MVLTAARSRVVLQSRSLYSFPGRAYIHHTRYAPSRLLTPPSSVPVQWHNKSPLHAQPRRHFTWKPIKSIRNISPHLVLGVTAATALVLAGWAYEELKEHIEEDESEEAQERLRRQQELLALESRESRRVDSSSTGEIDRRLRRGETSFYPPEMFVGRDDNHSDKTNQGQGNNNNGTQAENTNAIKKHASSALAGAKRLVYGGEKEGPKHKTVIRIDSNSLPAYQVVEDRWSVNAFKGGYIVGIYDGHLSHHCAELLADHLPAYVADYIDDAYPSMWSRIKFATLGRLLGRESREEKWHQLEVKAHKKAITDAFVEMDREIAKRAMSLLPSNMNKVSSEDIQEFLKDEYVRETLMQAVAGSCAVMAYVKDGMLYVANTGDSRATLGVKKDGRWRAVRITTDQTPSDSMVAQRVRMSHPGEEETCIIDGRVLGVLGTAGAFGDALFKWPIQYHQKVFPSLLSQRHRSTIKHVQKLYFSPPYITALPEVKAKKLREEDRFLILASDGMWDELADEEAVQMIGDWIDQGMQSTEQAKLMAMKRKRAAVAGSGSKAEESQMEEEEEEVQDENQPYRPSLRKIDIKDNNGATHLLRHALGGGDTHRLARMLSGGTSANDYRDDITIHVLVFGTEKDFEGANTSEERKAAVFPQGVDMKMKEVPAVNMEFKDLPTRSRLEALAREWE
ncbi:Pyruvate dehyrogenase phosphatase catalytic subunit [Actinomortierella wolfii]|nr:Pyruvate dehyrogenase phosphatase catalytic subunit [Actinomortierella wolfii]